MLRHEPRRRLFKRRAHVHERLLLLRLPLHKYHVRPLQAPKETRVARVAVVKEQPARGHHRRRVLEAIAVVPRRREAVHVSHEPRRSRKVVNVAKVVQIRLLKLTEQAALRGARLSKNIIHGAAQRRARVVPKVRGQQWRSSMLLD